MNIGAGDIATVAGDGTAGYSGDNIAATSAELWEPNDVAVDSAGNLYIADSYNDRIRKVDVNGIITTVAGGAMVGGTVKGFSGDGGPATNAELNYPRGVAVDSAGNLYIADIHNNRVRKVDTNGIITTIAGSATEATPGMAAQPPARHSLALRRGRGQHGQPLHRGLLQYRRPGSKHAGDLGNDGGSDHRAWGHSDRGGHRNGAVTAGTAVQPPTRNSTIRFT